MRRMDRQNRPSIMMWCPSMNTRRSAGSGPDRLQARDRATRLVCQERGIDQSRWIPRAWSSPRRRPERRRADAEPVSQFHAAAGKGGVPLQLERQGADPVRRHRIRRSRDCSMFNKMGNVPEVTEYCAIYLGDEAYRMEKADYVQATVKAMKSFSGPPDIWALGAAFAKEGKNEFHKMLGEWTAYYPFMELFVRNTRKSWRAWGVNGGLLDFEGTNFFGLPPDYKIRTLWRRVH